MPATAFIIFTILFATPALSVVYDKSGNPIVANLFDSRIGWRDVDQTEKPNFSGVARVQKKLTMADSCSITLLKTWDIEGRNPSKPHCGECLAVGVSSGSCWSSPSPGYSRGSIVIDKVVPLDMVYFSNGQGVTLGNYAKGKGAFPDLYPQKILFSTMDGTDLALLQFDQTVKFLSDAFKLEFYPIHAAEIRENDLVELLEHLPPSSDKSRFVSSDLTQFIDPERPAPLTSNEDSSNRLWSMKITQGSTFKGFAPYSSVGRPSNSRTVNETRLTNIYGFQHTSSMFFHGSPIFVNKSIFGISTESKLSEKYNFGTSLRDLVDCFDEKGEFTLGAENCLRNLKVHYLANNRARLPGAKLLSRNETDLNSDFIVRNGTILNLNYGKIFARKP